ncbi:MAG: SDR family oxidoreductase [Bacteroidota bacterium]
MQNVALVTGASSGIGLELARLHASRGGDLVLVARREERLNEIKAEFERAFGIEALVIASDLTDPTAPQTLYDALASQGVTVDVLINNAGFGGHGRFIDRDWDGDGPMIQLNVTALTHLMHLFVPGMVARSRGRLMNVASLAGFVPGPLQAVYYATKAYVLSLSEAVSKELEGTGVTVTALCPGLTKTEFLERANMDGIQGAKLGAMSAEQVARAGYEGLLAGETVVVPGTLNKLNAHVILPLLPRSLVRTISMKTMEKG